MAPAVFVLLGNAGCGWPACAQRLKKLLLVPSYPCAELLLMPICQQALPCPVLEDTTFDENLITVITINWVRLPSGHV